LHRSHKMKKEVREKKRKTGEDGMEDKREGVPGAPCIVYLSYQVANASYFQIKISSGSEAPVIVGKGDMKGKGKKKGGGGMRNMNSIRRQVNREI